jgi:nicotinamidase-related amidase
MSDYYKKYLKYKEKYLTLQRQQMGGTDYDKNVLLIIDPQNDFSDAQEPWRSKNGSLSVPGASGDYSRIIYFIENNDLDEIHVSLDTHTKRHIGHPGFWQITSTHDLNNEGSVPITHNPPLDATDDIGLSILSIENGIISATDIKPTFPPNFLKPIIRTLIPRKYPQTNSHDNYEILCTYVNEYLNKFKNVGELAWVWPNHCLEQDNGNRIAKELQVALDKFKDKGKVVKYHIKGQNNLAEMFSIFGATFPVEEKWKTQINDYLYTGINQNTYNEQGMDSYDAASKCVNTNSNLNEKFMKQLLGDNNRVFVCGEAKTHCVKDSMIHLMNYTKSKNVSGDRIVLLANLTSPIPKAPDTIEQITKDNGFTIKTVQEVYRVKDSSKEFTWKEIEDLFNQKSNQLAKNNPKLNNKYKQDLDKLRKLRNELNFKEINSILSSYPLTDDGKGLAGGNINY